MPVPPVTPAQTETPPEAEVQPPEEETPRITGGQDIYLCFRAGESTAALLDILEARACRAAFFCDAAFLTERPDLLRRMAASGHAVGLLAASEEQLAADNALLERAVCGKTRLALAQDGGDAPKGYRFLEEELSFPTLGSDEEALELLLLADARDGPVSIWLGDSAAAAGLAAFLDAAVAAGDRCLSLTETVFL